MSPSILPPPRHVLWDWNGTLLDDTQACVNALNVLLAEHGLPSIDVPRYRQSFGFPVRAFYDSLGFVLAPDEWNGLARRFHDLYLDDPTPQLRPEAAAALARFRQAGIGQSILSACEQQILDRLLAQHDLTPLFAHVRGSTNLHGRSKVAEGYDLVGGLGLSPADVLLIGDTLHDQEVADALGCRCVLVANGHQSPERLRGAGRTVITSLACLPSFQSAR